MDEKDFEKAFGLPKIEWHERQRRLFQHFLDLSTLIDRRDAEINRLREAIVNSFICENTPSASDCPICTAQDE